VRIALIAGGVADAEEQRGLAAALRDAGQEVAEHAMEADGASEAAAGFAAELRSAWSLEGPEVVHATGWTGALAALAAARDAGLPVVTAFGSLAVTERRHGPGPVQAERARLERAIAGASRALIAASSEEADDLVRMGVSRRRVHVIPAGVDTSVFSPAGPAACGGTGMARARVIAAAGTDEEQSMTLAAAVDLVPGTELIACPPAARDRELAALLRSADVFVHVPAHEPRGTRCLQAMACGVPVIVSATGAHDDIMVDGTTGMLVAPGRPELLAARIRHLLGHPVLREACGVAAADRARSAHSRDRVAAQALAVYEAVAQDQLLAA
jgi:glycosyltransferase involved in cell wall biosynthesis